jgi:hypothetical protein
MFPLLHWHTRFSDSICLSLYFSLFSFLFSIPLMSCTPPFRPFYLQTLPISFPLSLAAYSSYTLSSLCNLAFPCPLLAPLSNIFLALSLPLSVRSIIIVTKRKHLSTSGFIYHYEYDHEVMIISLEALFFFITIYCYTPTFYTTSPSEFFHSTLQTILKSNT